MRFVKVLLLTLPAFNKLKVISEVISVKLFTGFVKLYLIEGKVTLNVTSELPINMG